MKIKILLLIFCFTGFFAYGSDIANIINMEKITESKSFFELGIRYASGMSTDPKGNLFIIDGIKRKILKLDKDLELITSFGKKGQGPGEFNRAYTISVDKKGNVFVMDSMNKIIKYSNSGELIEEKRLLGNVVSSFGFVLKYPVFIAGKFKNWSHQNVLIDIEKNKILGEFDLIVSPNYSLKTPNGGYMAPAVEYVGGHSFIDTFEDSCVIAEGERVFVRLIDSKGKKQIIKKLKIDKVKLTSKEINYLQDKLYIHFGGSFSKKSLKKLLSNYKHKNFVYDVKISKNRVYVFLVATDISIPDRYPVEIYNFKGELIKKINFPFVPKKISGNIAYRLETAEEDSEEIYRIGKYRIIN